MELSCENFFDILSHLSCENSHGIHVRVGSDIRINYQLWRISRENFKKKINKLSNYYDKSIKYYGVGL